MKMNSWTNFHRVKSPPPLIFGATSEVRQTGKGSEVEIRLTTIKPNPSLLRAFGRSRAEKKPGRNYLNICTRCRSTGCKNVIKWEMAGGGGGGDDPHVLELTSLFIVKIIKPAVTWSFVWSIISFPQLSVALWRHC